MRTNIALLACIGLLASARLAQARPPELPGPESFANVEFYDGADTEYVTNHDLYGSGEIFEGYSDPYSTASGQASVVASPSISLTSEASTGNDYFASTSDFGGDFTYVTSQLRYEFEITGPASTQVPIDVEAVLSTSVAGAGGQPADAGATLVLGNDSDFDVVYGSYIAQENGIEGKAGPPNLDINSVVYVPANTPGFVGEFAGVDVYSGPNYTASATADPYFSIDPKFTQSNVGYMLYVSPGVANDPISAAPEPSVWALMIGGVAMVGGMLRIVRRQARSSNHAYPT